MYSGHANLSVKVRFSAKIVTRHIDDPLRYCFSKELRERVEKGKLLLDEEELGRHYLFIVALVEA